MCFGPSSDLWVFALLFNRKLCSNCHLACSPWDTQWLLREMHFIINVNLYVFMTLLGGRGRQSFPGDICSFPTIYCPRQSKNNDKHCYRKWRVLQWHFWRQRRGGWSDFDVVVSLHSTSSSSSVVCVVAAAASPCPPSPGQPRPFSLLQWRGYGWRRRSSSFWKPVLQRITGLRVNGCSETPCPCTQAISSRFIKWPAWKHCTQQLQGKAGQDKKGKGMGTWFMRAFSASSSFPFYCHTHP